MQKIELLAVLLLVSLTLVLGGCGKNKASDTPAAEPYMTQTGLKITEMEFGKGAEVVQGSNVSIQYVGRLTDGKIFDATSRHNNQPLSFVVGSGGVIPGMEEGVMGMRVGGKRTIEIPPALGYGDDDMGVVPPNSTLIFTITLLSVN